SGGASGKGGTGGASGSGGTAGSAGKGGAAGTAGIDAGSAGSAGKSGAAGSGGTDAGSADSGGTGGAAGSGVTDGGPVGDAGPSAGCGKAAPPQVNTRQTIDVAGTAREYIVNYPTPYDPNRPYRVLFIHHGRGGNAEQNITRNGGWYGVGPLSGGSVIFVSPQGLATGGETGWPNTGGQDVAFIRALVPHINSTFCVDTKRIFTTGMSYGGNFSNTLGCQMGDVFRAIVPFAGWGPQGTNCVGKVASLVTHGTADTTIEIGRGGASRDHWSTANHCTATSGPYDPSPCVVYQGCDVGYPVGWCEHPGGHILPTFSGPAIWNFISQF
ncbi:MAG: prolyl oligopeptidase family serine peptidase, partial [Polyangiaceae bacterium]